MLEFDLISYYRDLLKKTVPNDTTSISDCVLKGWLHRLGTDFGFEAMRMYLYCDNQGKMKASQVYGDKDHWKNIDIEKLRKERTSYKNIFFVKIRYVRENGHSLTLGYLSFYSIKYISEKVLDSLDVLCMLYGNYIIKRLVQGKQNIADKYLSKAFVISSSQELPGTKIAENGVYPPTQNGLIHHTFGLIS